ncbi:hypothetical protein ACM66B_000509 [Microbotryomycetes sp. NB124-2]
MGIADKLRNATSSNSSSSSPAYGQPATGSSTSPAVAHHQPGLSNVTTTGTYGQAPVSHHNKATVFDNSSPAVAHHTNSASSGGGGLFGKGHRNSREENAPLSTGTTGASPAYGVPQTANTNATGTTPVVDSSHHGHSKKSSGGGGLFGLGKKNKDKDVYQTNAYGHDSTTTGHHTNGGGLSGFTFSKQDHLTNAQTKLKAANEAERAADEALARARQAVQEARHEITSLEQEADQEYRAAEAKMQQVREIRGQGDKLRFGA